MQACEPRQVRKKAAISGHLYVPQGNSALWLSIIDIETRGQPFVSIFF